MVMLMLGTRGGPGLRTYGRVPNFKIRGCSLTLSLTPSLTPSPTAANVPDSVANMNAAGVSVVDSIANRLVAKLTTPPPEPLLQPSVAVSVPIAVPVARREVYQTPPREVLRQISPIMSPATLSKNELNDAALTLKFLSEGWNSVDAKGKTKRPRSERRASTGMDVPMLTPTDEWAGDEDGGYGGYGGYRHGRDGQDEETPSHYSGKSRRAASRKCVAMMKEALFEETHLASGPQSGARSSFGTSSSFTAGHMVPGTAAKGVGDLTGGMDGSGTPMASSKAKGTKNGVPKVSLHKGSKKKLSPGSDGRKRSRNYSENSRVGRAVQNIYKYIIDHQTKYLDGGSKGVPERVIREEYGNNPDTSKALRYLVSESRINKEGAGGRRDPFSYTIRSVPSSSILTAEYDPKDKKTSLLRSLGMPPPELCITPRHSAYASPLDAKLGSEGPSGSTPAATVVWGSTPPLAAEPAKPAAGPAANASKAKAQPGGADVRLIDPPAGTTHEHHPTLEVSPAKEGDCMASAPSGSKQQGKFQPRLSFGDAETKTGDAKAIKALPSLPALPMLPSLGSLPMLPLLNSAAIDPAKAAELQTSFVSADKDTQTAMMVQVQTALINQTFAMMSRISKRASGSAAEAPRSSATQ